MREQKKSDWELYDAVSRLHEQMGGDLMVSSFDSGPDDEATQAVSDLLGELRDQLRERLRHRPRGGGDLLAVDIERLHRCAEIAKLALNTSIGEEGPYIGITEAEGAVLALTYVAQLLRRGTLAAGVLETVRLLAWAPTKEDSEKALLELTMLDEYYEFDGPLRSFKLAGLLACNPDSDHGMFLVDQDEEVLPVPRGPVVEADDEPAAEDA